MTKKIQGQFDATLPIAIYVSPEILRPDLDPCQFHIDDSRVSIWPLKFTEPMYDEEHDEWELPRLVGIRVWITRSVTFETDDNAGLQLARHEEKNIEGILIAVTRQFVAAVRKSTGQWDLDTRHPVHSYSYKYFHADMPVDTERPFASGNRSMPEYHWGSIVTRTSDLVGELTKEIWQQVSVDFKPPVEPPFYEELLYDAKLFRYSRMRYDAAALYAGIAVELMLERSYARLLIDRCDMPPQEAQEKVAATKRRQLVKEIRTLQPDLVLDEPSVRLVADLRNRVAHGDGNHVTWEETDDAMRAADDLKNTLTEHNMI